MTARIDEALSRAPRDLLQFEFEGLRFGALSVMDLVLALKISDFSELLESDRRVWLQYLRSCLLSHLIVDRACREMGVGRIVHVNDYSLLLGARTAARKHGVPCYGLAFPGHRNVDLRRYLILSNVWKPSSFKLLAAWPACRDLPLDPGACGKWPRILLCGSAASVRTFIRPEKQSTRPTFASGCGCRTIGSCWSLIPAASTS